MSSRQLWTTLGIGATTDRSVIRKAYAAKLKVTNPEDDPDGFQALRAAYEMALEHAERGRPWADEEVLTADADRPGPLHAPAAAPSEAPADPGAATREPPPGVSEAEIEQLREAFVELQAAMDATPYNGDAVLRAYEQAMKSPALDAVVVRDQAEVWVASAIVEAAPRADVLIGGAIQDFGWENERVRGRMPWVDQVFQRRSIVDRLAQLSRRTSPHGDAFRALKVDPKPMRRLGYWLTPGLKDKVEALLKAVDPHELEVITNPAALAWWRERLRPKTQWVLWGVILVFTTFLGVGALPTLNALAWIVSAVIVGLGAAVAVLARSKGREMVNRRWPVRRPAWLKFGWLGPAIAGLAMACNPPASQYLLPIIVTEVLAIAWAAALSIPDSTPQEVVSIRLYILLRITFRVSRGGWAALCCMPLLLLTIGLVFEMPARAAPLALVGAMAAFGFGFVDLRRAWLSVRAKTARIAILTELAFLTAATPLALWATAPGPKWVGAATLLVALLMFAHVTLAPERIGLGVRNMISSVGWIGFMMAAVSVREMSAQDNLMLLFGGMWVLAIAGAGFIGALREARLEPAAA